MTQERSTAAFGARTGHPARPSRRCRSSQGIGGDALLPEELHVAGTATGADQDQVGRVVPPDPRGRSAEILDFGPGIFARAIFEARKSSAVNTCRRGRPRCTLKTRATARSWRPIWSSFPPHRRRRPMKTGSPPPIPLSRRRLPCTRGPRHRFQGLRIRRPDVLPRAVIEAPGADPRTWSKCAGQRAHTRIRVRREKAYADFPEVQTS
jgi:hypothetical protein